MESGTIAQRLLLLELFPEAFNLHFSASPRDGETIRFTEKVVRAHASREGNPPPSPFFGYRLPLCSLYERQSLLGLFAVTQHPSVEFRAPALLKADRLAVITLARTEPFGSFTANIIDYFIPFPEREFSHLSREIIRDEISIDRALSSEYFLNLGHQRREKFYHIWEGEMDKFRAALSEAAGTGDFSLPEGFLYLGGNPLLVRQWLETQALANERGASDFVLLALCVSLHGTRLAKP